MAAGNRRRRDIPLDFTSLLDVTLIILFFFIMFSSFESDSRTREAMDSAEEIKTQAEEIRSQAEERFRAAEELEKSAESRMEEMSAELEELRRTAGDNEAQSDGISEFASGENIKMLYSAEGGRWSFEIRRGDNVLKTIDRSSGSADSLAEALAGTPTDKYIFCECILLSPEYIESRNMLDEMVKTAQMRYSHLLVSKTYV